MWNMESFLKRLNQSPSSLEDNTSAGFPMFFLIFSHTTKAFSLIVRKFVLDCFKMLHAGKIMSELMPLLHFTDIKLILTNYTS